MKNKISNMGLPFEKGGDNVKENMLAAKTDERPSTIIQWVVLLIVAPIALVCGIFIFIPVAILYEKWLCWQLRKRKRWLSWPELEKRIVAEKGTLIVEREHKGSRTWWTPDNVRSLCPHPPIGWMQAARTDDPFTRWCVSQYLNLEKGTAFLVEIQIAHSWMGLYKKYPELAIVEIPRIRPKQRSK